MSVKIVTVGDDTDHGGKVISGSPTHTIGDKPIARLHDLVDCPQKYPDGRSHGVNKIVEAHPTFTVGEVPVAVDGCRTECGCRLIASGSASIGD